MLEGKNIYKKVCYDYLISQLEEGRSLNIILVSHNAYWSAIEKLDNHFENCNITVFGGSTYYIKTANIEKRNKIENCDCIIFYSSEFYSEEEFIELKEIAFRISNDKNKRVSVGYLYNLPPEQRPCNGILDQIKISSFKNQEETIEETYPSSPYFTPWDLIELTLATADDYDRMKKPKLGKIL